MSSETLRKRAEEILSEGCEINRKVDIADVKAVLHELQVYQVELEMQNEELRKAQIEIEGARSRYADLYHFAPTGYITLSKDGLILESNFSGAGMLGTERRHLVKTPFVIYVDTADLNVFYSYLRSVFNSSDKQACELGLKRRDGKRMYVLMESVAAQGRDGSVPVECLTAISDVTARKETEQKLKQLNETLEQRVAERAKELAHTKELLCHSQKLDSLGRLAGGVAHDFNNILMAIMGYASLAESELADDTPVREYIEKILASSNKAKHVVQSLLAFSRRQPLNMESVNLNGIISHIERLLVRAAGENIICNLLLSDKVVQVMADRDKIEQVLINLTNNAVDAMPSGGNLTISTDVVELDGDYVKRYGLYHGGAYGMIAVSDTGIGMNDEIKGKIFEPFFTTKERGKGTGLGLPIAYGIVKQHNGLVTVDSSPGKGTRFNIYLPITEGADAGVGDNVDASYNTGACTALPGNAKTILLAEDGDEVREVVTEILERSGYHVITASNGEDAVKKFEENKDRVDMLLLDVMMPVKNGKDAYYCIKKLRPDVKALFMSGYSENIITHREIQQEGLSFIQKPVNAEVLLKKLNELFPCKVDHKDRDVCRGYTGDAGGLSQGNRADLG